MKKLFFLFALLLGSLPAFSQQLIDGVVAVVGNEPIYRSDLESQFEQYKLISGNATDTDKCWILEQMMQQKLLLSRARFDSLKVSDEQVEGELDRRMSMFIQQFGSQAALEKFYGKTVAEYKNQFREGVREQLLTQQMQQKVLENVKVTPSQVRTFFKKIPQDSLPFFDTEFEISQIVAYAQITEAEKEKAREKIANIRSTIMAQTTDAGRSTTFKTKAFVESEDPGSKKQFGDLGMQPASNYVPEFASAALALKKDEVSEIIETRYGFHIIQMIDRRGDNIHVRHILIRPQVSDEARIAAVKKLDSLQLVLKNDTFTFDELAIKASEDEETSKRGGAWIDLQTGSSKISIKSLDAATYTLIDKMEPGEISQPTAFMSNDGREAYRILYLKSETPPHRANLEQDYDRIKEFALEEKKKEAMDEWVKRYIPHTYIRIDPRYAQCEELTTWMQNRP